MSIRDRLERVARAAAARPLPVLLTVALLAVAGGLLALRLEPSTGAETLASRSSDAFEATDELHRRFGDDAVVVLIDERVANLVLTSDLGRTIRLEGCLGGNVPRGARPYGGTQSACAGLAKLKPVKLVYGPGTFLNESVRAVQNAVTAQLRALQQQVTNAVAAAREQAARAGLDATAQQQAADTARTRAQAQAADELKRLYLSSGIQGIPQIDSKPFISQIVFDPARGADVPKARFAALFPSRDAALIQLRLRPDLTAAERAKAIELIRQATRMPLFQLRQGGAYTVSGVPVVTDALADSVTGGIATLLIVAVAAMALALLLLFKARLRLLPLLIALAAAAMTFGAMALVGAGLTMAAIAVLPVLIGLAVDYAIQFQSRIQEQGARHRPPGGRRPSRPRRRPHDRHRRTRNRNRLPRPAPLADPDGPRLRDPARHRHRTRIRRGDHGRLRRARAHAEAGTKRRSGGWRWRMHVRGRRQAECAPGGRDRPTGPARSRLVPNQIKRLRQGRRSW